MPSPTSGDMWNDMAWNIATGLPGYGSAIAGIAADKDYERIEAAKNDDERKQAERDFASDMISATPGVGTLSSLAGMTYDVLAWGNDTSGNLENQLMGGKDQYTVDEDAVVRASNEPPSTPAPAPRVPIPTDPPPR